MRIPGLQRGERKMSELERYVDKLITEQASDWVEVMRKPGMLDRMAFARWLRKHERHAGEYLLMEAVDHALRDIDPQRRHSVDALLTRPDAEIVELPAVRGSGVKPGRRWLAPGLAAAVIAAVCLVAWWSPLSDRGWESMTTRVGEQRVIELDDGTTVYLNTLSKLQVRLSAGSRDVRLLAGEALFDVERDPTRPFLVHAGTTTVRAVGTQFNVYRKPEGTRVTVLEGKVEVSTEASGHAASPTLLTVGEEADVPRNAPLAKNPHPDLSRTVAWQKRRVMFRLEALGNIAEEFNRYNRRPRIRIEGAAGQVCCFSGVFDANDPRAFARMLGRDGKLSVESGDEQIVIRSLSDESAGN